MDEETAAEPAPVVDEKKAKATSIYTAWRNAHLNELPVQIFARLEAASEHLINEIAALL